MSEDRKICFCHNVNESQIRHLIQEEGARSLEEIQAQLKASTGCGGCEIEVRQILEEELANLPSERLASSGK